MGLFRWLFGQSISPAPREAPWPAQHEEPRRQSYTRSFTLVEATFDPDGDKTDLEWSGFHIHDDAGTAVSYDRAAEFNLRIFRVAGVSHRVDALQSAEFNPGEVLKLIAEPNNQYDRNAIGVWNRSGRLMVGYVPKDYNQWIGAALQIPGHAAMSLAEHRKDGRRVSLTVMFGPMNIP